MKANSSMEANIAAWRRFVDERSTISTRDADELETHLRDQIEHLSADQVLREDEVFLIAVKRMGSLDELSREFSREHSDRLWKQLVVESTTSTDAPSGRGWAIALALAAAFAVQIPMFFGAGGVLTSSDAGARFYLHNLAALVLLFPTTYFLVRRQASRNTILSVVVGFALVLLVMNVLPFEPFGATEMIAVVHTIVALWLVLGIAYAGGRWRSGRERMNFIRFTGEWVVYMVLLAIGGIALVGLTYGVFAAIGLDPSGVITTWVIPCGTAGAVMVAAWLVEAKQSVIENIAPVLTKLFTPLVTALLLVLILAGIINGNAIDSGRDLLIICDVVLVVVVGLLIYALSARRPEAPAGWFDGLQLVMMLAAIVIDAFVLIAMLGRIGEFGFSANKVASLGVNVIMLANLAGAAWWQQGFLRHRTRVNRLENWQTSFVPVYAGWAVFAILVMPVLFGFA